MSASRKPNPETLVQAGIVKYLKANGLKVKRRNVMAIRVGGSDHPWGPKGRTVRSGEVGEADLEVELPDGRSAYLEVKRPGWKAPQRPAETASVSTWNRYQHHARQQAFLDRQAVRGCPAGFVRSIGEAQALLEAAGVVLRARVAA